MMAEYRLHTRPRLGAAMTLATDQIVTRCLAAVARRGAGSRGVAGQPGLAAGDVDLTGGAQPPNVQQNHSVQETGDARRPAGERAPNAEPSRRTDGRPPLRVVAEGDPSTAPATPQVSSTAELVAADTRAARTLAQAASRTISRRQSQPPLSFTNPTAGTGAASMTVNAQSDAPAGDPLAASIRELASLSALRRHGPKGPDAAGPRRDWPQHALAPVQPPHAATPARATSRPAAVPPAGETHARTARGTNASATDLAGRQDLPEAVAALLTPALPDLVPDLAAQPTAPETDFEFEMRVRAALEAIMAEDMLRHGFTTTEAL